MPDYTPQQFVEKWDRAELKERASYQEHFMDLCRLVGHPTPADMDPTGESFTFEAGGKTTSGGQGFADVWYKGHFAIEYKGKGKHPTLDAAYQQLLKYREYLGNPPLLIVCDIEHWEIHTNFTGTAKIVHRFTNRDIATTTRIQRLLHWLFEDPNLFHPDRTTEQVTADAADVFRLIADHMRNQARLHDAPANDAQIARFLTKLVFCLFAEDVGLLPTTPSGRGIFSEIAHETREKPSDFVTYTRDLFQAMQRGTKVLLRPIPLFDGSLFENVEVEELSFEALTELDKACKLDWSAVEPSIFGTLFERSLDPAKRAQLGAHYTSREDILLIVEPVLMQPLRREWDAVQREAVLVRSRYDAADNRADQHMYREQLRGLRDRILDQVRSVKVLDPACGSGNFLYVSLQLLKDLEKAIINSPLWQDVGLMVPPPMVHPRQLFGIEINPIAHDLASIVVWIGYLQWLYTNGYGTLLKREPILEPLENIQQKDAILAFDEAGNPVEPEWPSVDVIVSNPPFLGSRKMRAELGDFYSEYLWKLYDGRVPGMADLVTYWFEKARFQIETTQVQRVGMLATNTIRQTTNREILIRIKTSGDIFFAWSDREWILEGASVRIAMIGFDNGTEESKMLNGRIVASINSDLTSEADIIHAKALFENENIAYRGNQKGGAFDIDESRAKEFINTPNPSGRSNSDVIKPWWNGIDITHRPRGMWLIDFGPVMPLEEAELYEIPLEYVRKHVKPVRENNNRKAYRERWWIHNEARPSMRAAIEALSRYIAVPHISKHRIFVWMDRKIVPDHHLVVFARADDYFLGVLHSRLHELWSLRLGAWHGGERPTYTPTTCFETFPFPWPPGQEPTDHPAYQAISAAAQQLHEERDAWLNPPGVPESKLKDRTLTNLYNALLVFRGEPPAEGKKHPPVKAVAGDFAPRLDALHRALDRAVCDAYGWEYAVIDDEEEILRRLLALNLERSASE